MKQVFEEEMLKALTERLELTDVKSKIIDGCLVLRAEYKNDVGRKMGIIYYPMGYLHLLAKCLDSDDKPMMGIPVLRLTVLTINDMLGEEAISGGCVSKSAEKFKKIYLENERCFSDTWVNINEGLLDELV